MARRFSGYDLLDQCACLRGFGIITGEVSRECADQLPITIERLDLEARDAVCGLTRPIGADGTLLCGIGHGQTLRISSDIYPDP